MGMKVKGKPKLFWNRDYEDQENISNFSVQVFRFPLNNIANNISLELLPGCN